MTNRAGEGGTCHAHLRKADVAEDQQPVEEDVEGVHAEGDPERSAHILQAAQHAKGDEHKQDGRRAKDADANIADRFELDIAGCAKQRGEPDCIGEDGENEQDAERHSHAEGEAGDATRFIGVAAPVFLGDFGLCADAEEVEDPKEAGECGCPDSQRGEGNRSTRGDEGGVNQCGERFRCHGK